MYWKQKSHGDCEEMIARYKARDAWCQTSSQCTNVFLCVQERERESISVHVYVFIQAASRASSHHPLSLHTSRGIVVFSVFYVCVYIQTLYLCTYVKKIL